MIWKVKRRCSPPFTQSRMKITVVSAATTSTTNITGFFIIKRGLSLAKAEPIAGTAILGSVKDVTGVRLRNCEVSIGATPVSALRTTVQRVMASCSTMGPRASAGKKVRPPTIRITPTSSPMNSPPWVGKVPAEAGSVFLAASEPAIAMAGMIMKKRPTNIATAPVVL